MKISKKFFDILSLLCPFYDDFIVFRTHNKFLIPIPMHRFKNKFGDTNPLTVSPFLNCRYHAYASLSQYILSIYLLCKKFNGKLFLF